MTTEWVSKGRPKGKGKGFDDKFLRTEQGKIVSFLARNANSGFITPDSGQADVFFDISDIVGAGTAAVGDRVEYDLMERRNGKCHASRIKLNPPPLPPTPVVRKSNPRPAEDGGPRSLRPGGGTKTSLRPGGLRPGTKPASKPQGERAPQHQELIGGGAAAAAAGISGRLFGKVVSLKGTFGFLQPIDGKDGTSDVFFRGSDVVGCRASSNSSSETAMPITVAGGRVFHLDVGDELSYVTSPANPAKAMAVQCIKEEPGAWRDPANSVVGERKMDSLQVRDTLTRLQTFAENSMVDEILQEQAQYEMVLRSPDFNPSHLQRVVEVLSAEAMMDETRADSMYRVFADSTPAQSSLRTSILQLTAETAEAAGPKRNAVYLRNLFRVFLELISRFGLRDMETVLPLKEIVEVFQHLWEDQSRRSRGHGAASMGQWDPAVMDEIASSVRFLAEKSQLVDASFLKAKPAGNSGRAPKPPKAKPQFQENPELEVLEADRYDTMPILPTAEEVLGASRFHLDENQKTFKDVSDYIHTHFMLLREDYVEPIRDGIRDYLAGRQAPKDLHVYKDTRVCGLISARDGLVYRIQLAKAYVRGIHWESSRRLMYGSLVCLSNDDFASIIWAVVYRRDEDMLGVNHQIDIELAGTSAYDDRLRPGTSFVMLENIQIYFEAYRHVLTALKAMRFYDVPLQKTLLTLAPKPSPPAFVDQSNDMWSFSNVWTSTPGKPPPPSQIAILQPWPEETRKNVDFDPSQLQALQHALTNHMALIQGPPGTGKTFIGLKIVRALLDNTANRRSSPILVVCYTNHALDQFLEGIHSFCEDIVRIGSRSRSDVIKEKNIKELVRNVKPSREYYQARRALLERRDKLRENMYNAVHNINKRQVELDDAWGLLEAEAFSKFVDGWVKLQKRQFEAMDDVEKAAYRGLVRRKTTVEDIEEKMDEELWRSIEKDWLELDNPVHAVSMMEPDRPAGGKASLKAEAYDLDSWEELVDEEEEIMELVEQRDRVSYVETGEDVEAEGVAEKSTGPVTGFGDAYFELKTGWLPTIEEHCEKLKGDLKKLDWREITDFWQLEVATRREVYRRWLLEVHHENGHELLPELCKQLARNAENLQSLERDRQLAVLLGCQVVGMTTTAVAKFQYLVKELRPEIVVVEEAAEVLEAHILAALHKHTQQVILIGDHQQLRPSTAVYRLAQKYHLDVSMFERLIANGLPHVTLSHQRRMRPAISCLIKPLYPELENHQKVHEYPDVTGVGQNVFFLSHRELEDDDGESHSKSNTHEAEFVWSLAAYLIHVAKYEPTQITVLSPYLGQVRMIRNMLRKQALTEDVKCTAVDNFQGEENDIILVSLVRSNSRRQIGFLAVENRVCVALTRAKIGMYIIGNSDMLTRNSLWSNILSQLRKGRQIGDALPLCSEELGDIQMKSGGQLASLIPNLTENTDEAFFASRMQEQSGVHARAAGFGEALDELNSGRSQWDRRWQFDNRGGRGGEDAERWARRGSGGYGSDRWDERQDWYAGDRGRTQIGREGVRREELPEKGSLAEAVLARRSGLASTPSQKVPAPEEFPALGPATKK
mmetsp:Transcript_101999/g.233606  ORF Transcript_101999/g.233606 Transcript_101999/m.233606 type:complete len:1568 (+) Transcript_101999:399-5102(+)|eukprot:CAMPEP_0204380358 /NCGR_PEP_ID=MMETSP0469-20131031/53321_1 /ASSEMBLY_ACC=CAM_ASM_000384 /TAXON_ID=2969 /ORGANISM="Oxyrrhis marina" /LENGTH=1567 /DNA_ID=CAMNT_0051371981 /DNA_START=330 /DNA_END=5033 /DNA_ORIENTATION=+